MGAPAPSLLQPPLLPLAAAATFTGLVAGTLLVEERAELAVKDLERAGGFDRANLLVATTTGSGWLDPGAIDSFGYLTGATRPSWPCSTRTCRRGSRTWSTSSGPGRRAGELFAGPPNCNLPYRDGRTVRFTNDVAAGVGPTWEGTRVLHLQHPSDPIVWWKEVLSPPA